VANGVKWPFYFCVINDTITIEPLATEFRAYGHTLRQIFRKGDVAVYARSLTPDKPPHELELIIIKIEPEKVMPKGKKIPAHERYPNPAKWGTVGWSFPVRYKDSVLELAASLVCFTERRAGQVREFAHRLTLEKGVKR
jgi:hypothetical protein